MELSELLGQVHVGQSPHWIASNIPNGAIHLTITSPPVYDDGLYILQDNSAEFGWRTYDEYLEHIRRVIEEIYKKTVLGGSLIIDCSSGPHEVTSRWRKLYSIPADIIKIAISAEWIYRNEIIWDRQKHLYPPHNQESVPNVTIRQSHHQILVFQKQGQRECLQPIEGTFLRNLKSVWQFDSETIESHLNPYDKVYTVFPEELLGRILQLWSCEGDLVFDPYAGSGQVIRVATKYNRKAVGVESDEKWKDMWKDLNL